MNKQDFIPVILGTDNNAYGMARSFHMEYGINSYCVGKGKLFMTNYSKITTIEVVENLDDPVVFPKVMIEIAKKLRKEANKLILIASSDGYAELVIRNKKELAQYYELPFVDPELIDSLLYKDQFYQLCEKHGLDYPATAFVTKENYKTFRSPFSFPIVLKPADSIAYLEAEFPGKKKAFIFNKEEELQDVLQKIYSSSYKGTMIVQDFIPGDDSNMRVLNTYSDQNGKLRLMCLGRPLLEDCTPSLIGNYVAIVNEYNDHIYKQFHHFLEAIGYKGMANFDMKYDPRDGKYKVFEINLRQGRSSFFVTASGFNLGKVIAEDLVYGKESIPVYGNAEHLWLGVPKNVALKYIEDQASKNYVEKLIKEKKYSTTLEYEKDTSIMRSMNIHRYYKSYEQRFEKYFERKDQLDANR